jgi:hypothetical protein
MNVPVLNTWQAVKSLRDVGFTELQAVAIVKICLNARGYVFDELTIRKENDDANVDPGGVTLIH